MFTEWADYIMCTSSDIFHAEKKINLNILIFFSAWKIFEEENFWENLIFSL